VELEPAKLLLLLGHPQGVVAALGEAPDRGFQRLCLFGSGLEGTAESQGLHKAIIARHERRKAAHHPTPKGGGIRAAGV